MLFSRTTVVAVAVMALLLTSGQSAFGQTVSITPATPIAVVGGNTFDFNASGSYTPPAGGFNQIKVTLRETINGVPNYTSKRATLGANNTFNVSFNHAMNPNATYDMQATIIGNTGQQWATSGYVPVP